MPQGGNTIGFGALGSLDRQGGSGQGGGGPRQSFGRNLCFNPTFNTGPDGFYPNIDPVSSRTVTVAGAPIFETDFMQLNASRTSGRTEFDVPFVGIAVLLVGGLAYNQDFTWTFEATTQSWVAITGAPTVALTNAQAHYGINSLGVTATAAGTMAVGLNAASPVSPIKVWPGRNYTSSAWVRTAVTQRAATLSLVFYKADGTLISTVNGTAANDFTNNWTQVACQAQAPAYASFAVIQVSWAAVVVGEVHYTDDVRFYDTAAIAAGGQDLAENSFASYYFYAKPNTQYTFSGFTRIAPDYTNGIVGLNTFNSYALQVYDPNDAVNFPTTATSIGTTLTGNEYLTWQRHAVTYTTTSVVTAPIEIRLYGNKSNEQGVNPAAGGALIEGQVYPWTWGTTATSYIMPLIQYAIGSYWNAIQIEEGPNAGAYIDGTQRGCTWWKPSNELASRCNYMPDGASPGWTYNGDLAVAPTLTTPTLGNTWERWFSPVDYGVIAGSAGPQPVVPVAGSYANQLVVTATTGTRSAVVFDYHGNTGFGAFPLGNIMYAGNEGTISFYARQISGATGLTFAAEDTTGTNQLFTQAFTLEPRWRRYQVKWSNPGTVALDSSTTRFVFKQTTPGAVQTFQVAGVMIDQNVIATSSQSNGGYTGDYMPGFPVEHQVDKVLAGSAQKSTAQWLPVVSHRSIRAAFTDSDVTSAAVPSFSGLIEQATISLSTMRNCLLSGSSGRDMREMRFSNDLSESRFGVNVYGSQIITLYGDPFVANNSYGFGYHKAATPYVAQAYARFPTTGAFTFWSGGRHSTNPNFDTGTQVATITPTGMTAPAFTVVSTLDTKIDPKTLDRTTHGLALVKQLRPVRFESTFFADKDQKMRVSFIAEEVAEVLPEVCSWNPELMGVDLGAIGAVLTSAIQELAERVEILEGQEDAAT